MGIKASDMPQWLWSNAESRAWIFAVCVAYLNYSPEESEGAANKFKGMGNQLFARTLIEWGDILPCREDANSMHSLIMSRMHLKGGMPLGFRYPHQMPKDDNKK